METLPLAVEILQQTYRSLSHGFILFYERFLFVLI